MNGPSGVFIPLITPFIGGEVDYAGIKRLALYYIKQGIDGLIPLATTGEAPVLSDEEEAMIITIFSEEYSPQTTVFIGLCGNNTDMRLKRIDDMNRHRFRGYLISSPYYNLPSQEGLLSHFRKLAANTDKEILIYNIPYR
ncbi:MAG: dihydrodipicolinate synthase family protein [Spirochaetales bacterium]|nr:dihydrodipicolinate synthase family protein [Spirochaetales bacterium]